MAEYHQSSRKEKKPLEISQYLYCNTNKLNGENVSRWEGMVRWWKWRKRRYCRQEGGILNDRRVMAEKSEEQHNEHQELAEFVATYFTLYMFDLWHFKCWLLQSNILLMWNSQKDFWVRWPWYWGYCICAVNFKLQSKAGELSVKTENQALYKGKKNQFTSISKPHLLISNSNTNDLQN